MARPLRIEYPGAWHHVMNRGRRGEIIFKDNGNVECQAIRLLLDGQLPHAHSDPQCKSIQMHETHKWSIYPIFQS